MATEEAGRPQLIRAVGLAGLTAISLNGVIGAGIFALPATVAGLLGPSSPLAYLIAALVVALIVACFAEAGAMFEQTGGPYLYAREAFGPFIGFEVGWMFLLSRLAAGAAVANAFIAYLGFLWAPLGSGPGRVASITTLFAVLTWLNLIGIRYGSWAVNVLTVAKLLPLALFIVLGLPAVDGDSYRLVTLPSASVLASLKRASLLLVFAFGGFENASVPTEEVKQPTRNLPIALISSIVITTVLYILIQIVALGTLPNLAGSSTPLASAAQAFMGSAGAMVITAGAILSTIGSNSALVLVGPRILYAMASGGLLPRALANVHARYLTPHVSVIVFAVFGWVMALFGDFAQLVAVSAIARLLFSASTCLAVPVLRRRIGRLEGRFRLPGGAVIPLAATGMSLWLLSGISTAQAASGAAALAVGLLLYLLRSPRSFRRGEGPPVGDASSPLESSEPFNPFPEPVRIEFGDVIDLHSIPARQIRAVVEDYLLEAHRRRVRWLRIVHGKGIGVQREQVRAILARTPFVVDFKDAPPEAGGWGATIVTLDVESGAREQS